jgi:hypothetical protein
MPRFQSDRPSVEAVSLDARDRGYVVIVNHSASPQPVTVSSAFTLKSVQQVTPTGERPVTLQGSKWKLGLQPFEAAVFDWR